jgi:STE24 endopeptidase
MFPLFSIIIAFVIAMSYPAIVTRAHHPDYLGVASVILLATGLWMHMANRAVRRVLADEKRNPDPVGGMASVQRLSLVVAYGAVVYAFHWPEVVRSLGMTGWVLLDELLVLAPFFLLLVISLLSCWYAEARLELNDFKAGQYVNFHLRQYLLPVIPVAVFLLLADLVQYGANHGVIWVAEISILYRAYPFMQWISLAVLLFVLYCLMPFLLKWFFKAKSLPAGPLRDRLLEFSKREGFRARDILLWPTGGNVMNAAVIGIAGPVRYVLMTDALVDELPADEVEAIFAHEVGHARHNHMLLFFLYTVAYGLLTFLVGQVLEGRLAEALGDPTAVYLVFGVGGFLLWFFILFGFISRRFEQQADVYGALSTGRVHGESDAPPREHPFIRALTELGRQLGDHREAKGMRHFPLGERITFLIDFLSDERVRQAYRIRIRTLFLFFFGLLLALATAAAATIPAQLREGGMQVAQVRTAWLRSRGERLNALFENQHARALAVRAGKVNGRLLAMRTLDLITSNMVVPQGRLDLLVDLSGTYLALDDPGSARRALSEALQMVGRDPILLALLGNVLELEGRFEGARLAYRDALEDLPEKHPDATTLRERLNRLESRP